VWCRVTLLQHSFAKVVSTLAVEASSANPSGKPYREEGGSDEQGDGSVEDVEVFGHATSSEILQGDDRRFERHYSVRRRQNASMQLRGRKCP